MPTTKKLVSSIKKTAKIKTTSTPPAPINEQLFGHVSLIEVYDMPNYTGIHALIALRDTPGKTIAIFTTQHRIQTLLESALTSGFLIATSGSKLSTAPGSLGSGWSVELYSTHNVILYSFV